MCELCRANVHGYESGSCVMCSNIAICQRCEYIYPKRLPSEERPPPKRNLWDCSGYTYDTSDVQPGDILCIMCCQEGAAPELFQKYILFLAFADIQDCVNGHGVFMTPASPL